MHYAYEWHGDSGSWFRSYGNENWEFDADGLMARRFACINDLPILEVECLFHGPLTVGPMIILGYQLSVYDGSTPRCIDLGWSIGDRSLAPLGRQRFMKGARMAIPVFQTLMLPILRLAADGEVKVTAETGRLSDQSDRRQSKMTNCVSWVTVHLVKAGLAMRPRRRGSPSEGVGF